MAIQCRLHQIVLWRYEIVEGLVFNFSGPCIFGTFVDLGLGDKFCCEKVLAQVHSEHNKQHQSHKAQRGRGRGRAKHKRRLDEGINSQNCFPDCVTFLLF